MNVVQILRRWQIAFHVRTGEVPKVIPISPEELDILRYPPNPDDVGYYTGPIERSPVIFGVDGFESHFGPEMRTRQLQMPVESSLCIADKVSGVALNLTLDKHHDPGLDIMYRRLTAHVCKDTTKLTATFEWDPFASFKRALRITKWWPIRTRTVEIEGKVLYPYLNVSLPCNRHHVTLAVVK